MTEYGNDFCPDCGEEMEETDIEDNFLVEDHQEFIREWIASEIRESVEQNHPNANMVLIMGSDLGWRNIRGFRAFEMNEFLDNAVANMATVESECTIRGALTEDGKLTYTCSHHDSPMGESLEVMFFEVDEESDEWEDFLNNYSDYPETKEIAKVINGHLS